MTVHPSHVVFTLALPIVLIACEGSPAESPTEPATPAAEADDAQGPQLRFFPAAPGELSAVVRAFMAEARSEDRIPLVYVGASWCEPCHYFHEAADSGELDDRLPRLALLELDLDRDGPRIEAAGCASRMIPLFAVPGEDGRCTDRRIEGSIHGPDSPSQILPRLRAILPTTP